MAALHSMLIRPKKLRLFLVVYIVCSLPSVLVGLEGLSRPFDAIPDQDLLWVSEALRLARGVAPSYADHPGAFWSIVFRFNLKLLKVLVPSVSIIDSGESLTLAGAQLLVLVARIQNIFMASVVGPLVFIIARQLHIRKSLSFLSAIAVAWSSGTLVGVSEIRHEIVSLVFILLSFASFLYLLGHRRVVRHIPDSFTWLVPLSLFFAAVYSKVQVLLISPLYFIPLLSIAPLRVYFDQFLSGKPSEKIRILLSLNFLWLIPWLVGASPHLGVVNGLTWLVINAGLSILIAGLVSLRDQGLATLTNASLFLSLYEILLFKVISPHWWSRAVTSFPSWLTQYTDKQISSDSSFLSKIIYHFDLYLGSIFGSTLYVVVLASTILFLLLLLFCGENNGKSFHPLVPSLFLIVFGLFISMSFRYAVRYEVYLVVICALYLARLSEVAFSSASSVVSQKRLLGGVGLLAAIASTLIAWVSFQNLFSLSSFVKLRQPKSFYCFGHHMDKTMANLPVAKCPNFNEASTSKSIFDHWSGPL